MRYPRLDCGYWKCADELHVLNVHTVSTLVADSMAFCAPRSQRNMKIVSRLEVQLRCRFLRIRIEGKHQMHVGKKSNLPV